MHTDAALKQNDVFLKKAYLGALFPCMLSILSSNINILVDGIIVGQVLGIDGLAALNLCLPVFLTLCVAGSFVVSGTAIAASTAIGRNEETLTQRFYHLAIGLSLAISIAITVVGILGLDVITAILCHDDSLAGMVRTYTGVTILGAAPKILLYVPFWFLRLDGRNREMTIVMATMAVGNIILDIVFLYGLEMGIFGAALASVMATAVAVAIGFLFLCQKKSGFHFGIRFRVHKAELETICKNGSPAALNNLTQTLRVFAVNYILLLYGNTVYVAMFAAVNCIGEFSLCLIQGVPQAAAAMLGVYCGEKDNGSARILMKLQWRYGWRYAILFGAIIVGGAGVIAGLYGLYASLYGAMACLAVSIFPGLLCGIFSGYYNVSDHAGWANLIIVSRVILFPVAALLLLYHLQMEPWLFMVMGEMAALIFWFACIRLSHRGNRKLSPYLLINDALEQERKVLDFSVEGSVEAICDACERVSEFCEDNGMSMKQVMRMSLSMEELMTMIVKENGEQRISFDLRLFAIKEAKGIRIRYNGREYNPFGRTQEMEEENYLGIRMIYDMVGSITYQRTFGMNLLQILI